MYKNLPNTAGLKCTPCQTWLNHWKKGSGLPLPRLCQKLDCSGTVDVGAHVQKISGGEAKILPLCYSCNALVVPFQIKDEKLLVSAKVC